MPAFLVILFVVVPLIELAVILQVGQTIGAAWTIALLVVFSILGAALLRHEGRRAWRAFSDALAEGRWPGDEVTQGALVIVGGTLLLTPGFVTDGVGFLLLLPFTRAGLSRIIRARVTPGPVRMFGAASRRASSAKGERRQRDVLDVEVVEIERDPGDREDDQDEGLPPGGRPGPGG
jgi:UPF0716 protein FxsA